MFIGLQEYTRIRTTCTAAFFFFFVIIIFFFYGGIDNTRIVFSHTHHTHTHKPHNTHTQKVQRGYAREDKINMPCNFHTHTKSTKRVCKRR